MDLMAIRRSLLMGAKKSKNLIGNVTQILNKWTSDSGTVGNNNSGILIPNPINVSPNTAYTLSWNGNYPYSMSACQYTSDDVFIIRNHLGTSNGRYQSLTFTTKPNCSKVILQYYNYDGTGTLEVLKGYKPMLELGSSLTPYEP